MSDYQCCGADMLFDFDSAQKQLKKYIKKGPQGSTRSLIKALSPYKKANKSLLDIGGGIGAIQWDFLNSNGAHATDVDASSGYLNTARSYALSNNWESKTRFIKGDFVDVSSQIETYHFVTLDKVICCYPGYQHLLANAMAKCDEIMGLTFPMGGPIAHIFSFFNRMYMKIRKIPFRSYIHSAKTVEKIITANGFQIVHRSISFPWRVWVFERK